jgi:type III secretion protein V
LGAAGYGARGRLLEARPARIHAPEPGPVLCVELGDAVSDASENAVERARSAVSERLGLPLAPIAVRRAPELAQDRYRVLLQGAPVRSGELPAGASDARIAALEAAAAATITAHARELLGEQETQALLDAVAREAPALVQQLAPSALSLGKLTELLQRLLAEQVPLRPLRPILEALCAEASTEAGRARSAQALCERVRMRLSRHVTHAAAPSGALAAHPLDPMIEDALRDGLRTSTGAAGEPKRLAIDPDLAREIVEAVRRTLKEGNPGGAAEPKGVLLAQPDVRPLLRELIEDELPEVRVLSYAELSPEVEVEMRAAVRAGAASSAA